MPNERSLEPCEYDPQSYRQECEDDLSASHGGLSTKDDRSRARTHVAIDGQIAVGKSTVIKYLKLHLRDDPAVVFVDEPVERWEKMLLLKGVYEGKLSPLAFQQMALSTRFGPLAAALQNPAVKLIISERSMVADRNVFARVNITESTERACYDETYNALRGAIPEDLDEVLIMLDARSRDIKSRIALRGRAAEQSIPPQYLDEIKGAYEDLYASHPPEKRWRLDATSSCSTVAARVSEILRKLLPSLQLPLSSPISVIPGSNGASAGRSSP